MCPNKLIPKFVTRTQYRKAVEIWETMTKFKIEVSAIICFELRILKDRTFRAIVQVTRVPALAALHSAERLGEWQT